MKRRIGTWSFNWEATFSKGTDFMAFDADSQDIFIEERLWVRRKWTEPTRKSSDEKTTEEDKFGLDVSGRWWPFQVRSPLMWSSSTTSRTVEKSLVLTVLRLSLTLVSNYYHGIFGKMSLCNWFLRIWENHFAIQKNSRMLGQQAEPIFPG